MKIAVSGGLVNPFNVKEKMISSKNKVCKNLSQGGT